MPAPYDSSMISKESELMKPYKKEMDQLVGFDKYMINENQYVNYQSNWDTDLISQEGKEYFLKKLAEKKEKEERILQQREYQEKLKVLQMLEEERRRQDNIQALLIDVLDKISKK